MTEKEFKRFIGLYTAGERVRPYFKEYHSKQPTILYFPTRSCSMPWRIYKLSLDPETGLVTAYAGSQDKDDKRTLALHFQGVKALYAFVLSYAVQELINEY